MGDVVRVLRVVVIVGWVLRVVDRVVGRVVD